LTQCIIIIILISMFERYTVTMCSSGPVNSSNTVLITILPLKLAIILIIIPTVAGGGLISHVCVFLSVCLCVCLSVYKSISLKLGVMIGPTSGRIDYLLVVIYCRIQILDNFSTSRTTAK